MPSLLQRPSVWGTSFLCPSLLHCMLLCALAPPNDSPVLTTPVCSSLTVWLSLSTCWRTLSRRLHLPCSGHCSPPSASLTDTAFSLVPPPPLMVGPQLSSPSFPYLGVRPLPRLSMSACLALCVLIRSLLPQWVVRGLSCIGPCGSRSGPSSRLLSSLVVGTD